MSKRKSNDLEAKIITVFQENPKFVYQGNPYFVNFVGKPRSRNGGECKTDVYINATNQVNNQIKEFKLSVKTASSNEFQDNKMTSEKALNYLGEDWKEVISTATYSLKKRFENSNLIFQKRKYPTQAESITLGWKLEIATKERNLSTKIPLTNQQVREFVYKGSNQPEEKRNSYIDKKKIKNSGVAEFIIFAELNEINQPQDVIEKMVLIDEYKIADTYFIFTANNYRPISDKPYDGKTDGARALAVAIKWEYINNSLTPNFVYDSPLEYTGQNDMKPILTSSLKKLGKQKPSDFDILTEVSNPKYIYR